MPARTRVKRVATTGLLASAMIMTTGCQFSVSCGPNWGKHKQTPGFSAAAYRSNWGVMGQPDGSPNLWAGGGQYGPPGGPGYYGNGMVPPYANQPYPHHQMGPREDSAQGMELPAPRIVPSNGNGE